MKNKKQKRCLGLAALIAAQILLLALQFFFFHFRTESGTLTPGSGLMPYSAAAGVTEQGLASQGTEGKFGATRWLPLRGGHYRFTVHYAAEGSGWMYPYQNLVLSNGGVPLPAERTAASLDVWVPQRVENFQLHFSADSGEMVITAVEVQPLDNNAILLSQLLLFLLADAALLLSTGRLAGVTPKQSQTILLLAALAVFASAPLLSTTLQRGDDILFHLHRIEALALELQAGTPLPVYLQSSWFDGQGYATPVFYCELFLYFPALLRVLGLPLQSCYQAYLTAVNAATVLTAWWSFRHLFAQDMAGLLGALLYTLTPYRLVNLYGRAAVGEVTAMVFLPLIAAGLWDLFTRDPEAPGYPACWAPLALGMWGCLMSHLLSTVMAGVCVFLVCLLLLRRTLRRQTLLGLCSAAGVTAAASLWYLVPLLDYMKRGGFGITGDRGIVQIQYTGAELGQLLLTFVPGGGSGKSLEEGIRGEMPITAGIALLLALLGFLLYALRQNDRKQNSLFFRAGCGAAAAACAAMLVCVWNFPWDLIAGIPVLGGVLTAIQFPWRWLGAATVLLTFLGCVLVAEHTGQPGLRLGIAVTLSVVSVAAAGYTMGTAVSGRDAMRACDLAAIDVYNCGGGEYLPAAVGSDLTKGMLPEEPRSGEAQVLSWTRQGTRCSAAVRTEREALVTVPLLYYPYYRASAADGTSLAVSCAENGQVQVLLPAGFDGEFLVRYAPPWYWYGAAAVSLAAAAAIILQKIRKSVPLHTVQKRKNRL